MARKRPRRQLRKSATREVTVELFGWPGEAKMISVIEEYWAVRINFSKPGLGIQVITVFESDDYEKTYAKYQTYVQLVAD